jgi:hypothetical protein
MKKAKDGERKKKIHSVKPRRRGIRGDGGLQPSRMQLSRTPIFFIV